MSFELQNKIRQNAMEMREVVTDLYQWQQEMELKQQTKAKFRKEERKKNEQIFQAAKEQQIRENKIKQEQRIAQVRAAKMSPKVDLVRDANTIKDYYKAWDKFDVDQQLKRLEDEQERAYRPYNPYEDSKNYKRAKPKTKVNIKGRRNIISDPTELKDKGNLHFQSLEYDKAIDCYSQCLKKLEEENIPFQNLTEQRKKLLCVVLSNRAMAQMKNHQTAKALQDATESLKYNPKYSKSYYRRAECLKKLGKYKQSLKDFRMVRTLQPSETKANTQIKKIQAFLSKRARQTREAMVIDYNSNLMMQSRRIEITEVDDFQASDNKEESNYLDEL